MLKSRSTKLIRFALTLLTLCAAAPAAAWDLSCADLCAAAQAFQGYGTGPDDATCLVACQYENSECQSEWNDYFDCVDNGEPGELCNQYYALAKECSVCQVGEVGTWVEDDWDTQDVVFVNGPGCNPAGNPDGTVADPLCRFQEGIQAAIDRQRVGEDTHVMVCPGTYREGYTELTAVYPQAPGTASVVIESVIPEAAVVSGSEDWSGAWLPQTEIVNPLVHNELLQSTDLNEAVWTPVGVGALEIPTWTPPTFVTGPLPVNVFEVSPTPNAGSALYFQQLIPMLKDRRVTFYIRPDGADRFTLELLRSSDGQNVLSGPWYSFQLPSGDPCAQAGHSSSLADFGVEEAGNGWYRAWITQVFDTHPDTSITSYGARGARLHLVGPLSSGATAEVMAPMLDHRPLDQFAGTPRGYLPTAASPAHETVATQQTFYLNDASQKTWTHDWGLTRYHWGWISLPPLMRRSEMVYIDGQPLRQTLAAEDMEPGTFLVEDGIVYGGYNYKDFLGRVPGQCSFANPCTIRILPPTGVNMSTAVVEVAVQPRLLWLNGLHDWELRGLRFQHATGAYDSAQMPGCSEEPETCLPALTSSAVSLFNARRLTVLENRVDWNNAYGLAVTGLGLEHDSDILLARNAVNDNGVGGEYFAAARTFTVDEEEFSRNNWRGRWARVARHATTGAKYSTLAEGVIRSFVAEDNYAHGLWLDYENQALSILDGTAARNHRAGLYFEANDAWDGDDIEDTTSFVVGCTFEDNETGVLAISSSDVRLDDNVISDNLFALSFIGTPREETDHFKYLRDWYVTNNRIAANCPHHLWMRYGDQLGASDYTEWQKVMTSLLSDYNTFIRPSGLQIEGFEINGLDLTFPAWQGCSPALDLWCPLPQDGSSQLIP